MRTTGIGDAQILESLDDGGSKAAHLHMVFKGDKRVDAAGI